MSPALYVNPHAAAMATQYAALDAALHAVSVFTADLSWFDTLDVAGLEQNLADAQAARAVLVRSIETDAAVRAALADGRAPSPGGAAGVIVAGLAAAFPLGAVAGSVAVAAATALGITSIARDPVAAERRRLDAALHAQRQQLAVIDQAIAADRATLARHAEFDRSATVTRLETARAARDLAEAELKQAVQDHAAAEERLAPLADMVTAAETEEAKLRDALALAEQFQRQLSEATTKAARGPIHGACGRRFGNEKPGEVVKELRWQLEGAIRTTAKRRARLAYAAADASRSIDHLVVDASNLCWVGHGRRRTFIGLVALVKLVPVLAERYRLTLVFDASIRQKLKMPRAALERHFGDQVEVHVVTAGRAADHTYLRYADAPRSCVVTNDNLRDFQDVPVVKEQRVLNYELLERMVQIPVLDVVAHFEPTV